MLRKNKSQVSIEFMVFVGIAIFLLVIFTAIVVLYLDSAYDERENVFGQRLANNLRAEVNIAGRVSDDYVRMFDLPSKVANQDYTLRFDKRYVIIALESGKEFVSGLSADIENTNPPSELIEFEMTSGSNPDVVIEKKEEKVYVCALQEFLDNDRTCVD